ncbi:MULTISPECIES: Flp pilus assembly protein CpaB [Bradyrhizobium]|jgi:pilus assembly protein CpaB|uniref:CtpC protein n=2 Tax=Bradyrhizobium diazoefficiens TaxID=1355477 RepID=Q89WL1_BRADU|nr:MULTISPECIES: Flp pilus assembly protein CpaB [Bradyrhizobium]MBP1060641.1 pilus assembly protein CpaB [Bradyrhizobium japonicum]AND86407.1 CtpC protein [Bradyrhizobium diazoefficiens USDA 110]APO49245.1 Flp pilus assembly protein CpaB [Bradyrhizobium diazoefficiens]AWO87823.1 Flp pilus assembly protein CpaB [Bradyrhizobium diazoefficiens]KGJ65105.1 putative pilus assembly protein CpaB [Bradyrhizobium diazoefficiens SEMIA 5080]
MNTARIVVLVIALGAGGVAAYLASGYDNKPAPALPVAEKLPTVEVLVAKNDIQLGQAVKPEDLQWQSWPAATASGAFIRRDSRPEAQTQIAGSIARVPLMQGEPIREQKLVRAEGSGFMAAILPSGMRAVSTDVTAETSAGGFILPNDRVDIVLTRRLKNPDVNGPTAGNDLILSEVILTNIRVLAIDQAPKEKDGQNAVVGKTVTLELKPDQVATLTAARQGGTLQLALRSIVDANATELTAEDLAIKRSGGVNVIRYGVQVRQLTSQK